VLDATIVNVAVPTLGTELHASIPTIQWVLTGYLLALASVIPLASWAGERFGTKQVWIAALGLFMVASALAGLAWSTGSLIAFRVLQGAGAGLIMPVGQTILARAAGPSRIGRVMTVVGIPLLLAPIFGPVIGGAIIDAVSWRWIFFVNVPVGLLAVTLAWRLLPTTMPQQRQPLDVAGLALLSPGIAILVYGLSEIGASGGLATRPLLEISAGAVLLASFARHALVRGGRALIDVSLLHRRGFAAAAATNLFIGIALFGSLILLPLYYQLVRGEDPLRTGLLLVPQGLGAALAMRIAGRLTDRLGARLVISSGVILALLGTLVYTQVDATTSFAVLSSALLLVGLGLGATVMPSMAVAYGSVPREAVAHATATINVVQRIAGSIGTALFAVVLQRAITANLPDAHGTIGALAATAPARRPQTADALAGAFGTTFWVAVVLVATALLPALLLPAARAREASRSSEPAVT
jgi:EmrB/QacA subfamily drug resistance transporter